MVSDSDKSTLPWSWYLPSQVPPHRGTAHRGITSASRVIRNVHSYLKFDQETSTVAFEPNDAADITTVVRTRRKIPGHLPVYMFEAHVIDAADMPPASRIAVGVQFGEASLASLPGVDRHSLAVQSDSGLLHTLAADGKPFLHFGKGDTVSVAVNAVSDAITVYKNGLCRGAALVGLPAHRAIYPCIGFDLARARLEVNFGQTPFRYPEVLDELQMDARTLIAQQISASPPLRLSVHLQNPLAPRPVKLRVRRRSLPTAETPDSPAAAAAPAAGTSTEAAAAGGEAAAELPDGGGGSGSGDAGGGGSADGSCPAEALLIAAILDHLTHSCCWETAAKLSAALLERAAAARSVAGGDGPAKRPPWEAMAAALVKKEAHAEIRLRKRALELVVEGKVAEAVAVLRAELPNVVADGDAMMFELHLQMLIEQLRGQPSAEQQVAAMRFAREQLQPRLGGCDARKALLTEALTLLAYPNPAQSPAAHLFAQTRRQDLAQDLNRTLMKEHGSSGRSGLEALWRQLHATHGEMSALGMVSAGALSVDDVIQSGLNAFTGGV
eukprot:jgi/Ulvmu1/11653/UM008_0057.1